MTIWVLLQVVVNLMFGIGLIVMWSRLKRPPQDDPRLSRGLQLLQSKISVLEDLSDRTEVQVNQLTTLLEQKGRHLQQKITDAEAQINAIDRSMKRSLEVAEIFQDKIPHEEIIERRNTVKYVQAARLAHQGVPIEEIIAQVDLPRSEVEFIAKVNRDQLMFSDQMLPDWAKKSIADDEEESVPSIEMNDGAKSSEDLRTHTDFSAAFQMPKTDLTQLKKIGEDFRQACEEYEAATKETPSEPSQLFMTALKMKEKIVERASQYLQPEVKAPESVTQGQPVATSEATIANAPAAPTAAPKAENDIQIEETTRIVPSSYLKTELKVNKDESRTVPTDKIRKVLFPRIDATDEIG